MAKALRKPKPGEVNYPAFDRWSVVHAAFGVLVGTAGTSFGTALAITIGYEIIENSLKRKVPKAFPAGSSDTAANHIGDSVSFMSGWLVGRETR